LQESKPLKIIGAVEAIRTRPGMYIGDTGSAGLHHVLFEIVNNAVNEALAGHCDRIEIVLHTDGSATVRDNGRGIPVEGHPKRGTPVAELLMTELYAGAEFGSDAGPAKRHIGGAGIVVVNALSEMLCLRIYRHGVEYIMRFRKGEPEAALAAIGAAPTQDGKPRHGTEITFTPDATIFTGTFDVAVIARHLQELAVYDAGAAIALADERGGENPEAIYRV
jgi:DNA gyrase subunit B